jgi:Mlc titration factor MtfA (ptsG expression regulator)
MTGGEAAGSWLLGKLAPALGGLFGGLSLAMFWTPEKLREKGKIASVFLAGGISAMAGFALTGVVALQLGVDQQKLDLVIGLSWLLGLVSIAVMNWLANYMSKREHLDIAEVGHEINAARKGETAAPIRAKPRTRKPAAKKATPTKRAARPAGAKA